MNEPNNLLNIGIPLQRASQDTSRPNGHGYKLIDLCKNSNLYLVNGRVGEDRGIGQPTCKGSSVIDYAIASFTVLERILKFKVNEFEPLFSDIHNPLTMRLNIHTASGKHHAVINNELTPRKWNTKEAKHYSENINKETVNDINVILNELCEHFSKEKLNGAVERIGTLFVDTAADTFGYTQARVRARHKRENTRNKAWFGNHCRTLRRKYTEARSAYKQRKTPDNKQRLLNASKSYRNVIRKYVNKHNWKTEQRLTELSQHDTHGFWKLLKEKQDPTLPPLNTLYDYFKNINSSDDNTTEEKDPSFNIDFEDTTMLNESILQEEILAVVKNLKNNKACGIDQIINEYIKQTIGCMVPVYVKLFNLCLNMASFLIRG
ncbi:uncharacterized protein LOC121369940 [Gigantopelta aegis]|uniref:uncharacterized protein LOC121369940 n=1 Tax=Gigantopelta aegis TaxID=1735272 RepID=UPI001B88BEC8|nr:uncharacterized protein LOC121369940 [Gigantopelta aegis]